MRAKPWVVKKIIPNNATNKVCYPYYVSGINYSRETLGEIESFFWLIPSLNDKMFDFSNAEYTPNF